MTRPGMFRATGVVVLACAAIAIAGCRHHHDRTPRTNPIVGTWLVKDPNAPFPVHLYVFNGDGTMQQANPDAGDPHGSDSDGKGVWVADGDRVKGKWVEILADRATRRFTGRLEISFDIHVTGDTYAGTEVAHSYDASGNPADAPATPAALEGSRVSYP